MAWANRSSVFLRLALGLSFLSAVADRFGLWGAYGQPNVSWGSFARFVQYVAKLNWFMPRSMIPVLAIIATAGEGVLGLLLLLGWKTRIAVPEARCPAAGLKLTHSASSGARTARVSILTRR
jgi:uncharacterized membrane protein YphA (DoxX/SURF4 family)